MFVNTQKVVRAASRAGKDELPGPKRTEEANRRSKQKKRTEEANQHLTQTKMTNEPTASCSVFLQLNLVIY